MKLSTKNIIVTVALLTGAGIAQAQGMHGGHDMSGHTMPVASAPDTKTVQGTGVVKSIDTARSRITLEHDPIPALNWPAMVMPFKVADIKLLEDLKAGDRVMFDLKDEQVITSIDVMPAK